MTIITIGSSDPNLDVFAVADVMETKGMSYCSHNCKKKFYPDAADACLHYLTRCVIMHISFHL